MAVLDIARRSVKVEVVQHATEEVRVGKWASPLEALALDPVDPAP